MEMCYNGTLVMPTNYVVINDNEMQYIDGGVSSTWNTTAGKAESYYNAMYWVFVGLACTYVGSFAVLGGLIGGGVGALIGGAAGMLTGSMIWGFANACDSAATAASKFKSSQKVKCTETLNKRLVLSISVKKR